jgi:ribosomal protein S18 acetylase RimI-like enzyme
MTAATRAGAYALLGSFLLEDAHYRSSAAAYGDGGLPALDRSLTLFLSRPDLGFVWLAEEPAGAATALSQSHASGGSADRPSHEPSAIVGACVVSYAISTARGGLVAKLDDVVVAANAQRRGVGGAMLHALALHLRALDVTRVDCACHRDNAHAWRFYERHGFRPLGEERIALLLA